jgi:hypothetical protein
MRVEHLHALVEDQSMEIALRALLPKLLGSVPFAVHPFQGKTDLLKNLEPLLQPARNQSRSFQLLCAALRGL